MNSDNDPLVRNIPTLTTVAATLDTADLGKKFTFVLYVYNREGQTSSVPISYLFSTIPEAPSAGPIVLNFSSKNMRARYLYADNIGGSPLLSYNLQILQAYSGLWIDAIGQDPLHSLATEHTIESL